MSLFRFSLTERSSFPMVLSSIGKISQKIPEQVPLYHINLIWLTCPLLNQFLSQGEYHAETYCLRVGSPGSKRWDHLCAGGLGECPLINPWSRIGQRKELNKNSVSSTGNFRAEMTLQSCLPCIKTAPVVYFYPDKSLDVSWLQEYHGPWARWLSLDCLFREILGEECSREPAKGRLPVRMNCCSFEGRWKGLNKVNLPISGWLVSSRDDAMAPLLPPAVVGRLGKNIRTWSTTNLAVSLPYFFPQVSPVWSQDSQNSEVSTMEQTERDPGKFLQFWLEE